MVDTHPVDAITTTRMLQLAQVMEQLPANAGGDVPIAQVEQAREAYQSIESVPAPSAPAPLLVSEPQHVDLYA